MDKAKDIMEPEPRWGGDAETGGGVQDVVSFFCFIMAVGYLFRFIFSGPAKQRRQ